MKVLVACEQSQRVSSAFRRLGHDAYSCDILPCSGGHPEWHILGDCSRLLNGRCSFYTEDGVFHSVSTSWDLIIAHPPCTYFSNATMVNLGRKDYPDIFNDAWRSSFFQKRSSALDFVKLIWSADCEHICIENVVGYLSTHFMKPTQYIEPYFFGEPYRKKSCLWLKGLPLLVATNVVTPICKWVKHNLKNGNDLVGYDKKGVYKSSLRSLTFVSVAEAMASQWGGIL